MTDLTLDQEAVDRFFAFARERHAIYLRRRSGIPRPWTDDSILNQYRITNVYRELDKTTQWFRQHVRDPLRDRPEVLLATVLFRWFNTIRSGETVFAEPSLLTAGPVRSGETPWEAYLRTGEPQALCDPLRRQGAPWVTGAYMIRSPEGMDKLDGVVQSVHEFAGAVSAMRMGGTVDDVVSGTWREIAEGLLKARGVVTLEEFWRWLKQFYGLGPFLAYEIVTDLRHTALLDRAPDILTWANPGPGALRGAALMLRGAERGRKGRLVKSTYPEAHAVMGQLLNMSRDPRYWPQFGERFDNGYYELDAGHAYISDLITTPGERPKRFGDLSDVIGTSTPSDWPAWEMREPEMWLCEFAKYERTRLGFGRPRGTYS